MKLKYTGQKVKGIHRFFYDPYIVIKFVGTDAFLMHSFLPHMSWGWKLKVRVKRLFYKFLDRYIVQEYLVDHVNLGYHLRLAGFTKPYREVRDPVWHPEPMKKLKHKGFNVVYYDPSGRKKNKEALRWRFGIDIIEEAKKRIKGVRWIMIDGTADMNKVWPIADFYARPCRVDGASRLRQEAAINDIPFYWTYEEPNVEELIKTIALARKVL